MAYCEWHGTIIRHFKTRDLASFLEIPLREAVGIRGCLYGWAIEHRPGGILPRRLVPQACEAEDMDPDRLIQALTDSGLIETVPDDENTGNLVAIHDWSDYVSNYRKSLIELLRYYVTKDKNFERIPLGLKEKLTEAFGKTWPTNSALKGLCANLRKIPVVLLGAERNRSERSGAESPLPPTLRSKSSGSAGPKDPTKCPNCDGVGMVHVAGDTVTKCSRCQGSGKIRPTRGSTAKA